MGSQSRRTGQTNPKSTAKPSRSGQHPAADILHSPLGQFDPRGDRTTPAERARAHNRDHGRDLHRGQGAREPFPFDREGTAEERVERLRDLHERGQVADEGVPPDDSATGMQGSRRRLRARDPWAPSQPVVFRDPPSGEVKRHGG